MNSLRKELDRLWKEAVYLRAGYKSELSGKEGKQIGGDHVLNAHHIIHKPNNYLRYSLDNGICVTSGEHLYGCHGPQEERYREWIKEKRGQDIYERLSIFKNNKVKDLLLVKIYLNEQIEKMNYMYRSIEFFKKNDPSFIKKTREKA
jgi:hypothetical protein